MSSVRAVPSGKERGPTLPLPSFSPTATGASWGL